MGLATVTTAIGMPTRLLLTVRRSRPDLGLRLPNPFWVGIGPELLARVEFWTGFPVAAIVMGLVILRLTQATAPMRRVLRPVLLAAAPMSAKLAVTASGHEPRSRATASTAA